jgi:CheY-like chemotaxis protein
MSPTKILAVDDEPDFELLLKQRFRQRIRKGDLAFRFARHGEEALAVLAEEPDIGLLLLDINMPVMDGLTLLSELRSRRSPARAVIVSAMRVKPTMSANSTATVWRRTGPSGSSLSASRSTRLGEK